MKVGMRFKCKYFNDLFEISAIDELNNKFVVRIYQDDGYVLQEWDLQYTLRAFENDEYFNLAYPKISAFSGYDGVGFGGWCNSLGDQIASFDVVIYEIMKNLNSEPYFFFIDADRKIAWISHEEISDKVVRKAKSSFGVDITDVRIGYPL